MERDDGGGEAALLRNGLFMIHLFVYIVSCLFTIRLRLPSAVKPAGQLV